MKKKCVICSKEFEPKQKIEKYCSTNCAYAGAELRRKELKIKSIAELSFFYPKNEKEVKKIVLWLSNISKTIQSKKPYEYVEYVKFRLMK